MILAALGNETWNDPTKKHIQMMVSFAGIHPKPVRSTTIRTYRGTLTRCIDARDLCNTGFFHGEPPSNRSSRLLVFVSRRRQALLFFSFCTSGEPGSLPFGGATPIFFLWRSGETPGAIEKPEGEPEEATRNPETSPDLEPARNRCFALLLRGAPLGPKRASNAC